MSQFECDADVLNSIDPQSKNPIPVIYQSGYLTIKDFDPEFNLYTLGFPNKEVEDGFLKFLLPNYTSIDYTQSAFFITNFVKDVRAGRIEEFMKRLSSLFADTPYELVKDLENHYQNVLFIVTKLMGSTSKPNTTRRKAASTCCCKQPTTLTLWSSNSTAPPRRL
jgi:hypothetical protein